MEEIVVMLGWFGAGTIPERKVYFIWCLMSGGRFIHCKARTPIETCLPKILLPRGLNQSVKRLKARLMKFFLEVCKLIKRVFQACD